MEWLHLIVTVVASLAAAWLGSRIGAQATLGATVVSLDHDLRMRVHDRILEAAEQLLDLLADDVYTYREPDAVQPDAVVVEDERRPLMQASFHLANRAFSQDVPLTNLCHEYAGVLGRGATQLTYSLPTG
jgi:hypothetical protein